MKHPEHDRLLKEIITGDELTEFREASLDQALRFIRQRQRRQRTARLCALAALPFVVALGITISRTPKPAIREVTSSNSSPVAISSSQPATAPVKFINDEELMALFPDRPVALIGKPGQQQLVFLDKPAKRGGGHL